MADIVKFVKEAKDAFGGGGPQAGNTPFGNTIAAIAYLNPDKVALAEQVASAASSYNVTATSTTSADLAVTNGLLEKILYQLARAPGESAQVIAATIGDIKMVQNDVVTGRLQGRTSVAVRRPYRGSNATIT